MVVPPQQQLEYSSLIPNYSAPSSVCTSDSGGGGSQGKLRTIRLHRRMGGQQVGPPTFGFSVRGGREHGTGFFVSAVEQGSEAHCQGLRIGDQIVRINGYLVVDAVHREVLRYIKSQNHLELRVRTVGMIPVKDKRTDPLTWRVVDDERLHPPPEFCSPMCNGNSEDIIRDVRLFLNVAPRTKLGCGICKGPEWKSGIFVQFTKENGLAREAGLRPGDQILQCNGVRFIDIPFSDAVNVLKTSRQLDLIIRKGAGLDLFPGESSGYNSSASSVNGDQSPNWGDAKRLSIVKEESVELEERLGQLDSNHRSSEKHHDWDQIDHDWEKSESKQRRKDSPVLRVHFEENGNDHNTDEANRDMSELSLVSSGRNSVAGTDGQQADQKQAGDKLAEIRMVSQQLETKTVVVEVHRSEEMDDTSATSQSASQRLGGSEEEPKSHSCLAKSPSSSSFVSMGSSSAGSSLSSAISQELQRRSKRRENNDYREPEKKKDILKSMDGEKRQQHEQLMDEFKRVHRKMFAHTVAPENQGTTCCHSEGTQLKISHSLEERETKRLQKEEKEEKVSHQRTLVTTKEHSFKDRQGTSEVVREVTIVTKKSTNAPPPPPPMPLGESGTSSPSWKPSSPALSLASSGKTSLNSRPPSCPTPDYDTSSSSTVSSPSASLIIINKNSPSPLTTSPHKSVPGGKPQTGHSSPTYASVNKNTKTVLSPQSKLQSPTKNSAITSQTSPKNSDSVEMRSIESFTLKHPQSTKPRPPDIYFVPVRNKTKPQNASNVNLSSSIEDKVLKKQRPVSITIGEYPSGVERRVPTRFDFLPAHNAEVRKSPTSQTDGSVFSNQLQSELVQTLSRSNLRKKTDLQEPVQNGISKDTSSAKGTVTISVNCQSPAKNHVNSKPLSNYNSRPQIMNGANKIHIESNNNSRSKISIVSAEPKSQVPPRIKPAIRNAADKIAESLGSNNRVTITVPNGVESK